MATIKDVAKKAGVSTATVSRYLNGGFRVSEGASKKISRAVGELNYLPNSFGRSLRTTKSKLILVLIPSLENNFLSRVLRGVQTIGDKNGYSIIIGVTHGNPETEKGYFRLLKSRMVDGAISVSPCVDESYLKQLYASFPIIQCSEFCSSAVPHISVDNTSAAYDMVSMLVKSGCRRIGYTGFGLQAPSSVAREEGYKKALQDAGIEYDPRLVYYTSLGFSGGKRAAGKLLLQRPDAIFAAADIIALGVVRYACDAGVKVPEKLFVAGFDGIVRSRETVPELTTVIQPAFEMGQTTCRLIIDMINGRKVPTETIMKYRISERQTTAGNKPGVNA